LIIGFARLDPAGRGVIEDVREQRIDHVSYVASLDDRLKTLDLPAPPGFAFEFHLVKVPAGSEAWKANYLQFFYKQRFLNALPKLLSDPKYAEALGRSDMQFMVAPNHLLTLAQQLPGQGIVRTASFAFDPFHHTYRAMIGMPTGVRGNVRIAVLDTGVAQDFPGLVGRRRDFVNPAASFSADDDHGHGTVVSLIIHDLVPDAELFVYKIADAKGRASEWDTLVALAACRDVDVVNLSVQFGLGDRICKTCGRESHSSRSAAFENTLGHYAGAGHEPIFVAAAGNASRSDLAYPARFGGIAAIGAITSRYVLSSESNYGELDHALGVHPNHFVLPGGEPGPMNAESVGAFVSSGSPWHGTSMASAYASGVIGGVLAKAGPGVQSASLVLQALRTGADRTHFASGDPKRFGNGVLRA